MKVLPYFSFSFFSLLLFPSWDLRFFILTLVWTGSVFIKRFVLVFMKENLNVDGDGKYFIMRFVSLMLLMDHGSVYSLDDFPFNNPKKGSFM